MAAVTLGSFAFQNMEIPEEMPFSGPHLLAVHKLIGGDRTIDAMGDDPAPIEWSGIFLYEGAADRARELDAMKASGGVFQLTWGSFSRQVIIRSFDPKYLYEYRIPYRICVEVLPSSEEGDDDDVGSMIDADFDALDALDLTSSFVDLIGMAQDAIGGAASAALSGLLADSPLYALQAAVGTVSGAADAMGGLLDLADGAMREIDLSDLPGAAAAEFGGALLDLVDQTGAISDAATAAGYMGRIAANLGLYGG